MGILNLCAVPPQIPTHVKRRSKQPRGLVVNDFCKAVTTDAERSLFLECYFANTKQTSCGNVFTDWTALMKAFNLAVLHAWETSKCHSDLYLKEIFHLKAYQQHLTLQAATAATAQASAAIQGLTEASEEQPPTPKRARLGTVPSSAVHGSAVQVHGHGLGGAGGMQKCTGCGDVMGHFVDNFGHSCLHYLIVQGNIDARNPHAVKQRAKYLESNPEQPLPSKEECEQVLAKRLHKAESDAKRKK